MEKTIEIKAIDKENAVKRALNILGIENYLDFLEQNLVFTR